MTPELFQENPYGICQLDPSGACVRGNSAFEKLTGYPLQELLGMDLRKLAHEDDMDKLVRQWNEFKVKQERSTMKFRLRQKDGVIIVVHVTLIPARSSDFRGTYVVFENRTYEWELENTLKKTQELLNRSQSITELGTWEFDPSRQGSFWSDEMFRMFGIENTGFIKYEKMVERIHPEDREQFVEVKRKLLAGEPWDTEFRVVHPDGEVRTLQTRRTRFIDQNGQLRMIGTTQDITEQKRLQDLTLQSEKLRVVGELAAGLAHEIRNPLTVVQGFLQVLHTNTENKDRYHNLIRESLQQIEFITEQLLAVCRPLAMQFQRRNLVTVVQKAASFISSEASARNVTMHVDANPSHYILCNEKQLQQAFLNLFKNAIEAMPQGGEISVNFNSDERNVTIQFADDGEGIPTAILPRVFDPFYTTKATGTGLGLLITERIIENHGGSIEIDSNVGCGTTVRCTLPLDVEYSLQ